VVESQGLTAEIIAQPAMLMCIEYVPITAKSLENARFSIGRDLAKKK